MINIKVGDSLRVPYLNNVSFYVTAESKRGFSGFLCDIMAPSIEFDGYPRYVFSTAIHINKKEFLNEVKLVTKEILKQIEE